MKILFWIIASLNLAVLGLFFLLGLAAAGSTKDSGVAVAAYMLTIPLLLIAGSIFLFMRGPTPLVRGIGFLLQAAPLLILLWGQAKQRASLSLATNEQGELAYFREGPPREMVEAIARNDAAAVTTLATKVDVNKKGYANATYLSLALEQLTKTPDSLDVLKALLKAGANPNLVALEHPLMIAIQNTRESRLEPVKLLLAAGANPNTVGSFGDPLFFVATGKGAEPELFQMLLDGGADLKTKDKGGNTVTLSAVQTQNWPLVLWLMEHGVDWKSDRDVSGMPLKENILQQQRTYGDQPGLPELVAYLNKH